MLGFVFQPNVRGDVKQGYIQNHAVVGIVHQAIVEQIQVWYCIYIHIQMLGDADPYFYLDYKSETI